MLSYIIVQICMFNQNIRSFDNFTFCNLVITCKLFYVKKLMHYLEYKNNVFYNKHFLQSYYSDSNKWLKTNLKLYTQLQLCMKEWGWIPDHILFRVWGQWIVTNLGHEKDKKNAVYFFLEVVMPRSSPFFYCSTKSNRYISCNKWVCNGQTSPVFHLH